MRAWVGWAILVGVAIFVGFVALFWRIGLFDIPETDPGAKAFATGRAGNPLRCGPRLA